MTSHEYGTVLCSMANFNTTAIETLRRELISYRAIISNLAAVTQRERMEIAIIAQHVIEAIPATSNDTITATSAAATNDATTKNATTVTSVTPSAATKEATTLSKSYQLECFDSSTRLPRHFHEAWFGAEP